ncbi:MAG TPA: hypothetical protein PL012_03255, partial [Candidatus Obscuribacter sp.]|nr:hypothetical protein [Candidatus Obscuribacter sp.]
LLLLQHVRDEAHRFAVTYHRKLRAKRVVSSKLDSLKGLGAKRRKLLIDHFGSFEKIKKASLDEILALTKEGLPEKLARTIYDFVRQPGAVNLVAEGVAEAEAEGAEAADSETLALEEDGVLVFSEELDMDEENGAEENGEEESGEEESES